MYRNTPGIQHMYRTWGRP